MDEPPRLPFWSWRAPLGRAAYAGWGVGLFFLKYNLDRIVVLVGLGKKLDPWSYLTPTRILDGGLDDVANAPLLLALLATSAPFIAAGVFLTLRRLRDVGWPLGLVALFFVPFLNLLFFAFLCALPSRDAAWVESAPMGRLTRVLTSSSRRGSALITVGLTVALGVPLVAFATMVLRDYGWGLFIGVPFCMGLLGALLDSLAEPRTLGRAMAVAATAMTFAGILCVLTAVEGFICVIMAAPLAYPLALFGALIGHCIQRERWNRAGRDVARLYSITALALPLLMFGEAHSGAAPPLVEATTRIVVQAPPAVVWRHVVSFGDLPPPRETVFLVGIAYPVRARLEGMGVGAVRYCEFSTGPFVEPITVWDEHRRLAFDVLAQPHPMREWSPYAGLEPAHLNGFFQSQRGEFRLTALDGGRATLLEGSTWYRQDIWPGSYWRQWSDWLIHTIHRRVLEHIRTLAEGEAG